MDNERPFSVLVGKTITAITLKRNQEEHPDDDSIEMKCSDGTAYRMFHGQRCCESVWIEDICGELNDLVGNPILQAEESVNESSIGPTWTFYRIATIKGHVVVRWCGESNGFYSERVDFEQTA